MDVNCKECKNRNNCPVDPTVVNGRILTCNKFEKEGEKNMGKGLEVFSAVMKAFGEGLAEGAKYYEENHEPEIALKTDVTLGVEELKQLKGMASFQLERLFKGKTVHLSDDPAVYRELKNFSSFQLEKIFGEEEKE